jgi:hypothetical protein
MFSRWKVFFMIVAIFVAGFWVNHAKADVTFLGSGPQITLLNMNGKTGAILEGSKTSYQTYTAFIIDKIDVAVPAPDGQMQYITANDANLIGATVNITGSGSKRLDIYPSGSVTLLTGSQVSSYIQTAATMSYQTSMLYGQLASGTLPPVPVKPIMMGTTNF